MPRLGRATGIAGLHHHPDRHPKISNIFSRPRQTPDKSQTDPRHKHCRGELLGYMAQSDRVVARPPDGKIRFLIRGQDKPQTNRRQILDTFVSCPGSAEPLELPACITTPTGIPRFRVYLPGPDKSLTNLGHIVGNIFAVSR